MGSIGLLTLVIILALSGYQASSEHDRNRKFACVSMLRGRLGPVFSLAWSPDGRSLAVSGFGPAIKLWELRSGRVHSIQGGTEQPRFVLGWSGGGRELILGGLDVPVESWNLESIRRVEGKGVLRPSDASSSLRLMAKATRGAAIRVWGAIDGRSRLLPSSGFQANSVAFAPDGRTIVTGEIDCSCRVWDAQTGLKRMTLRGDARGITCVAYSPDGSRLASAGGGPVKIWDAASGAPLASLGQVSGGSTSVVFSPDGKRLALASWDGTIRVWDLSAGVEQARLEGHLGQVLALAWSPDGRTLASGGYDATVRLWDVARPIEVARTD
jgi:WD40 repeat protein